MGRLKPKTAQITTLHALKLKIVVKKSEFPDPMTKNIHLVVVYQKNRKQDLLQQTIIRLKIMMELLLNELFNIEKMLKYR